MFKLCHFIKDNGRVCNAPARRGHEYCRHHLELLKRECRIATARQGLLQAIMKDTSFNAASDVKLAIERIKRGLAAGELPEEQSKVVLSGLRLVANMLRRPRKRNSAGVFAHEISLSHPTGVRLDNSLPVN